MAKRTRRAAQSDEASLENEKTPSSKEKPEKVFTEEEYRHVARGFLHFSFKATNSNIASGGVRLSATAALDLPYISVRTLMWRQLVPFEVRANTFDAIGKLKHFEEAEEKGLAQAQMLSEILTQEAMSEHLDLGGDPEDFMLDARLPQIFLPREDGDLVVTPLVSTGVMTILNRAVTAHNEAIKGEKSSAGPSRRKKIRQAVLPFGGSNPQNVGAHVKDLKHPLVAFPPTRSLSIRRVKALQHKGVDLALSYESVKAYADWRSALLKSHKGVMPTTQEYREQEAQLVQVIAEELLVESEKQFDELKESVSGNRALQLNEDPQRPVWLLPSVTPVVRGMMCVEERTAEWRQDFAQAVAVLIAEHPTIANNKLPGISSDGIAQIAAWIREVLI